MEGAHGLLLVRRGHAWPAANGDLSLRLREEITMESAHTCAPTNRAVPMRVSACIYQKPLEPRSRSSITSRNSAGESFIRSVR
jgi:hypothetical protein